MSIIDLRDASKVNKGIVGEITIELVDKNGKIVHEFNNFITDLGLAEFLALGSADVIMRPYGVRRGDYKVLSRRKKPANAYNSTYYNSNDYQTGLFLLNSPETLTSADKKLPVYDANNNYLVDKSKVTGFATYNRTPATVKEGVPAPIKGADLMMNKTVAMRWLFDYTQGNGEYNKICIGSNIMTNRFNGVAVLKGLESTEPTVNATYQGYFCAPNMGVTSENEMLLGGKTVSDFTVARYLLNLQTGEETTLETTNPKYGLKLGKPGFPQIYDGTSWFRVTTWAPYTMISKTIIATNVTSDSNTLTVHNGTFFEYNNMLYFGFGHRTNTLMCMDKNLVLKSGSDIITDSYLLPADVNGGVYNFSNQAIAKYGSNYIITFEDTLVNGFYIGAIVVSDFLDAANTVVDILPMWGIGHPCNINGNFSLLTVIDSNTVDDLKTIVVNDGTSDVGTSGYNYHLYMLLYAGNMMSAFNLPSPITKTSEQQMQITYKYSIS